MRTTLFVVAAAVAACTMPDEPVAPRLRVPEGCQPLAPELSCTLPYPSDFFLESSSMTRTGAVVALHDAAKPRTKDGEDADAVTPLRADGFSLQPTIVGVLREAIADGLPSLVGDPEMSRAPGSATLLLEANTLVPVAHYADVDPKADEKAVAIAIRPFSPLKPRTRYLVALTGVRTKTGLAEPPAGFRLLRDGRAGEVARVAALAPRFETDVFAPLARAGIDRSRLQLAWDFTTGSAERPREDMLQVKALAEAWLETHVPKVTIDRVVPDTGEYWQVIHGTIRVPLLLDKAEVGGRLHRGSDGRVATNGEAEVPFLVAVPASVRDQFGPGRSIAFGHGFFGTRKEAIDGATRTVMARLRAVPVAIDWWGMSQPDLDDVVGSITSSPSQVTGFTDRVHQAIANWIVVTRAMKTTLAETPELHRPASGPGTQTDGHGASNAGALLYDPTHIYYWGASLGHILGGTLFALNRDLERAAVNVGGAAFTHMMPRARPFAPFDFILATAVGDPATVQAIVAMLAAGLDRIDPATYAPFVDRPLLMQIGLGDAEVPNEGSFFHARALGLGVTQPSAASPWGLAPLAPGATSGLTLWDFGVDTNGYRDPRPMAPNAVHEGLRVLPEAMDQMDAFLAPDGVLAHPCTGPCTVR